MDPLRVLPGTAPEAPEHATPQPRDGAARWRQELERAQWALRTQRAAAAGPSGRGETAPALAATQRAASATANSAPTSVSSSSSATAISQAQTTSAAGTAQPFPQARNVSPGPNFAATAATTRTSQQSRPALAPAAQEAQPFPERFIWPRTHVHVMARDGAAQVWVRDGTLDENERRRLAAQLAARLRASGVRLASLAVNGEEIYNLEGVTSWQ